MLQAFFNYLSKRFFGAIIQTIQPLPIRNGDILFIRFKGARHPETAKGFSNAMVEHVLKPSGLANVRLIIADDIMEMNVVRPEKKEKGGEVLPFPGPAGAA